MLSKKVFALALVFAFAALPFVFSENVSASGVQDLGFDSSRTSVGSFTQGSSGSITVFVTNTTDEPITATVYVTADINTDRRLAEVRNVIIPAADSDSNPGVTQVTLSFRADSPGTRWVQVWADYEDNSTGDKVTTLPETLQINIKSSIWQNTTTYIVIIIVIIVLAILVWFFKIRSPAKKTLAAGTFTEMEYRKRASRGRKQAAVEEPAEAPGEEFDFGYEDDEADIEEAEPAAAPVPAKAEKVKRVKEKPAKAEKPPKAEKPAKAEKEIKAEPAAEQPAKTEPAAALEEKKAAPAAAPVEKKEYTGRVSSTKKKQTSPQRKSNPSSRKSSKRK